MTEIKLRQLAQMDPEYAKMLEKFFEKSGLSKTDYLDMNIEDFLKRWGTEYLEQWAKILAETLRKRDRKI